MSKEQTMSSVENIEAQHKNITYGAVIQSIFTSFSRIFGMIREIIFLHIFGVSAITDAFIIAFTIPNVMRRFFAEGSLSMSFVPVYIQTKEESSNDAKNFFKDTFGFLLVTLSLTTLLGILCSPLLVKMFAYGLSEDSERFALTNTMTKWLFPYIFMISLVALFGAYLQCYRKFAAMSAAPIFLNLGMIFCMIAFANYFSFQIYTLVAGVLLGGICQVFLMIWALKRENLWSSPTFSIKTPAMKKLLKLLGPSLFGVFVYQLNIVVLRQLSSFLGEGQITYYYNADRLTQFVTGVFIVSIAAATLPELSSDVAKSGDKKLFSTLQFSLRLTSFIITPCALGLMVFAKPIVSVIYFHGAFTYHDTYNTALALAGFAPSLVFFGFSRNLMQAYYALKDTKTPVIIGVITVLINLFVGLLLLRFNVFGIALTLSVSSFAQYFLLKIFLKKLFFKNYSVHVAKHFFCHLGVAAIACGVGLWVQKLGSFDNGFSIINAIVLGLIAALSAISYFGFCFYFKFSEARKLFSLVSKKINFFS